MFVVTHNITGHFHQNVAPTQALQPISQICFSRLTSPVWCKVAFPATETEQRKRQNSFAEAMRAAKLECLSLACSPQVGPQLLKAHRRQTNLLPRNHSFGCGCPLLTSSRCRKHFFLPSTHFSGFPYGPHSLPLRSRSLCETSRSHVESCEEGHITSVGESVACLGKQPP